MDKFFLIRFGIFDSKVSQPLRIRYFLLFLPSYPILASKVGK